MRISNLLIVALFATSIWGASVGKDSGAQVANVKDEVQNEKGEVKASVEPKRKSGKNKVKKSSKKQKEKAQEADAEADGESEGTEDKPKKKKTKDDDVEASEKNLKGESPEKEGNESEDDDKEEDEKEAVGDDIKMPPMLTMDTFDVEVAKGLTLVEFFSPYCSHCKNFAPTWEKIYKSFKPEMEKLQIDMRQVNCVESGDLCNREQVMLYPDLRIYHSNPNADTASKEGEKDNEGKKDKKKDKKKKKKKESSSKHLASFPKGRLRTEDNVKKFLRTSASEYNDGIDVPSSSKMLNTDEVLLLLSGDTEEPFFVSFFPCTEDEWKNTDEKGTNLFSRNCPECHPSKLIWDKLSNKVAMKTGHFSCLSNPNVCKALGYTALASHEEQSAPKFVMFMPKKSTQLSKIEFKNPRVTFKGLRLFSEKINNNYRYKLSSGDTLRKDKTSVVTELSIPVDYEYPLDNKISLVYFLDKVTVDEDNALLPYLLEYVADSPFNFDLSICKFDNVGKLIEEQNHALVNYVNLLYKEEGHKEYNEKMNVITSYTTKPTVLLFHENSLINHVFQSYAPEDIRSFAKVKKFLERNKYPLHQELTPSLVPEYFDPNAKGDALLEKVVIVFLDTKDEKQTTDALSNIALAAHAYHLSQQEYYFNEIIEHRELKNEKTDKLKEKGANSNEVVSAMREEIPHNFDKNRVLFVFIDLSSDVFSEEGSIWKLNNKEYVKGDVVIISKDNKYFWESDVDGTRLRNDPTKIKDALLSLLDPTLVGGKKVAWRLVGSPYNNTVPFMNYVHRHGFLGYLALFVVLWGCFNITRRRRRRPSGHSTLVRQGIIGNHLNSPKKD